MSGFHVAVGASMDSSICMNHRVWGWQESLWSSPMSTLLPTAWKYSFGKLPATHKLAVLILMEKIGDREDLSSAQTGSK